MALGAIAGCDLIDSTSSETSTAPASGDGSIAEWVDNRAGGRLTRPGVLGTSEGMWAVDAETIQRDLAKVGGKGGCGGAFWGVGERDQGIQGDLA